MESRSRETLPTFPPTARVLSEFPADYDRNPNSSLTNVRVLPDVGTRSELIEFLNTSPSADRSAERLRSFTLGLLSDPAVPVRISEDALIVDRKYLMLQSIVAYTDIRSEGTASKWRKQWTDKHYIHANTIYLSAFETSRHRSSERTPPPPAPVLTKPSGPSTSNLQVLLTELRHAHQAGLEPLVTQLSKWIESELSHSKPFESSAKSEGKTATGNRGTAPLSRELVSSSINKSSLTNFPDIAEPSRERGNRKSSKPRTEKELLSLLKPLSTLIRQRHLKEMGNRHNVEAALRGFNDEEVTHAVNAIARLVRKDSSITSPIGLLVHHAKAGSVDYFSTPTTPSPETQPEEPINEPDDQNQTAVPQRIAELRQSLRP